jgi:hypothetical protein
MFQPIYVKVYIHRGLPSPLSVLLVLKDFISTPIILTSSSHILNSSVTGTIEAFVHSLGTRYTYLR